MNSLGVKILIVEDNEMDVKIILRFLHRAYIGVETFVVFNGKEALEYLSHQGKFENEQMYPTPDVIILDVHMPVLDGTGFVEEVQKDENLKKIPIIAFTNKDRAGNILHVNGVNGHVVKDFDGVDLIREINKVLCI